jgi:hypothetical protein
MSQIKNALARKKQQNPQFDYLFRVEMPDVSSNGGPIDPTMKGLTGGVLSAIDGDPTVSAKQRSQQSADPFQTLQNNPGGFSNLIGLDQGSVGAQEQMESISHRVYSIDAPLTTYETVKATDKDTFWYRAGNSDIGNVSMKIDEMEDGATLQYLLNWQKQMDNMDGSRNPPVQYKRNIKVIRLSASKLDMHVHLYKGYYPIEISPMNFSQDGNSVMQYDVQFSGDSVEHMFIPAGDVKRMIESEKDTIMSAVNNPTYYGRTNGNGNMGNILNNPQLIRNVMDSATRFFF